MMFVHQLPVECRGQAKRRVKAVLPGPLFSNVESGHVTSRARGDSLHFAMVKQASIAALRNSTVFTMRSSVYRVRAIIASPEGDLTWQEIPDVTAGDGDVLIRV